jgi:hypothetical protein
MVKYFQETSHDWEYPKSEGEVPSEYIVQGNPFGTTAYNIFNRTQALTGFGAAIGSLIDQGSIADCQRRFDFAGFRRRDFAGFPSVSVEASAANGGDGPDA